MVPFSHKEEDKCTYMVTIGTFYYPSQFTFTFIVIKQNTVPVLRFYLAAYLARTRFLTTTQAKQRSFLLVSLTLLQFETASQSADAPKGLARNLKFKCLPNELFILVFTPLQAWSTKGSHVYTGQQVETALGATFSFANPFHTSI